MLLAQKLGEDSRPYSIGQLNELAWPQRGRQNFRDRPHFYGLRIASLFGCHPVILRTAPGLYLFDANLTVVTSQTVQEFSARQHIRSSGRSPKVETDQLMADQHPDYAAQR